MAKKRSTTSKSLGRKPTFSQRLKDANIAQAHAITGGLAFPKEGPKARMRGVARGDVVDYAPVKRFMGQVLSYITDTKNNYSNMGKTYGSQGAKFRSKVAGQLRAGAKKAAKNPDNQRNYP